MRHRALLIPVFSALTAITTFSYARSWGARPIVAHEWGVQVFDSSGDRELPDLPDFLHTPKDAPKGSVTTFRPPVREMQDDTGERDKPILYFYLEPPQEEGVPVAVSLGFAFGKPKAWYPQADHVCAPFREVPDAATLEQWLAALGSPDFRIREEASGKLAECGPPLRTLLERALGGSKDAEIRQRLEACLEDFLKPQLTWDHLKLVKTLPQGMELPGKTLKADHWVRQARQVDAAYVTNGVEGERYVFYEGKTAERPAIQVKPGSKPGGFILANVSRHPVHDVFLVCVPGFKEAFGHVETLAPGASTEVILRDPRGPSAPDRLLLRLQANRPERKEEGRMYRKPCEPQGPTTESWLFEKEAEALLAIWGKDFFRGEGARLIYREDVAALDEAMPLALHTDMYHFIQLSRVGLVLVKGLDL